MNKDMIPQSFSIEMIHIMKEYNMNKTAGDNNNNSHKVASQDLDSITRSIIKDIKMDRQLWALCIGRRLLYCCPPSSQ